MADGIRLSRPVMGSHHRLDRADRLRPKAHLFRIYLEVSAAKEPRKAKPDVSNPGHDPI